MMLSRVFASKGKKCYQSSFVSFFHTSSIRRASTGTTIKNVLVLGSSGALGSAMVDHLSRDCGMKVIGADIHTQPQDGDNYVQLPSAGSLGELTTSLALGLDDILDEGNEIDAIVCANGGWEGDPENIAVDGMAEGGQQYGDTIDRMIRVNLYPVVAAGYAAQHFMANEGLFVVIGATAALSPTPGMLGYGMAKSASHHFVQTVGAMTGKALSTKSERKLARRLRRESEYLDDLSVVGILPTTIDTPMNRKAMPDAKFEEWTKPHEIAKEVGAWIGQPLLRPHSGSLINVLPDDSSGDGRAVFRLVR